MLSTAQAGGAAEEKKSRFYVVQNFYMRNGTQVDRIHDFLSKDFLPKYKEVQSGPVICLEALVAPHMPQVAVIAGFRSLDEVLATEGKLFALPGFGEAWKRWEAGQEPPYEHLSTSLLAATDYSPEISPMNPPPKSPRIFELRTYHSPTLRQLKALHERFAGPEIKIFHRCGVHPVLYTSTVFGPNKPNLTYVIPFDNLAAREKAWAAFGADPEWVKVRQESIEQHGQIASVIQISLFRATAYSPVL
jgi:hypothetical protein